MSELIRESSSADVRFQRFLLSKKDFVQQFSHMYSRRLAQMKPVLMAAAAKKWEPSKNDIKVLDKVIDSEQCIDSVCCMVGTIYKEMALKPSVLDEFKERNGILGDVRNVQNFASESDKLFLEDDTGRAVLVGMDSAIPTIVTGVTVAVLGQIDDSGRFNVKSWLGAGEHIASTSSTNANIQENTLQPGEKYIALLSGIEVGAEDSSLERVQLMVDFLQGKLGLPEDQELARKVVRCVVAGNIMGTSPDRLQGMERFSNPDAVKANKEKIERHQSYCTKHADYLITQIAVSCPTDVLPGPSDPANYTLPQQPLHPCLIPTAARCSTLTLATNPYDMAINGRVFIGHSGQPLDDIMRQVKCIDESNSIGGMEIEEKENEHKNRGKGASPLDMLGSCLEWGHLAPTAPDSLACYPFLTEDPFVMDEIPDVFFAGGQKEFATGVKIFDRGEGKTHKTRLVLVPSFKETGQIVLMDLATLEPRLISFNN
jgi:DNA polymerase delta subunit 2